MDVVKIFNEREELSKSLSESYSHLWDKGREYARADHHYKIAYKKEVFLLHEIDKVAWTTCPSLAHGDETRNNVAKLRLARDMAKIEYEVMQEKIQGIKLQLRLIESQLERDWSQAKRM